MLISFMTVWDFVARLQKSIAIVVFNAGLQIQRINANRTVSVKDEHCQQESSHGCVQSQENQGQKE